MSKVCFKNDADAISHLEVVANSLSRSFYNRCEQGSSIPAFLQDCTYFIALPEKTLAGIVLSDVYSRHPVLDWLVDFKSPDYFSNAFVQYFNIKYALTEKDILGYYFCVAVPCEDYSYLTKVLDSSSRLNLFEKLYSLNNKYKSKLHFVTDQIESRAWVIHDYFEYPYQYIFNNTYFVDEYKDSWSTDRDYRVLCFFMRVPFDYYISIADKDSDVIADAKELYGWLDVMLWEEKISNLIQKKLQFTFDTGIMNYEQVLCGTGIDSYIELTVHLDRKLSRNWRCAFYGYFNICKWWKKSENTYGLMIKLADNLTYRY